MDELTKRAILEALNVHRDILTGGLVMAGGMKSRHATDAEREVCCHKAEMIDRAAKDVEKLERLASRVADLERACKMAHDTLADVAGVLGRSWHTVDIDKAFRELVRVLYIDNGR